jgi:hypothetical protein
MAAIAFIASLLFLYWLDYNFVKKVSSDGYTPLVDTQELKVEQSVLSDLKQVFVFMKKPKMMLAIP